MKRIVLSLASVALAALTLGVAPASAAKAPKKLPPVAWRVVDPENTLVIDTNQGRIVVELVPEVAPQSVARIKQLTRMHFYDGLTFFRVIDDFMAQTGDPANTGQGASVLPNIPAEFTFKMDGPKPGSDSDFTPVLHPPGHDAGFIGSLPVISQPAAVAALMADGKLAANPTFCQGVFGIARGDDPNSANSQFFMMRQPHTALDAKYTAIGRVIVGEDVVRQIKTGEPVPQPQDRMQRVEILADMPDGVRPTVRVADVKSPYFAALLAQTKRDVGDGVSICDIELPGQAK